MKEKDKLQIWDKVIGSDFIEEIDLPLMNSWFLDGTHSVPPLTPLYAWHWVKYCGHGLRVACTELSIPTCKGWEVRTLNGSIYCAFHIVREPKEIAEREVKFRQALRPWLENFDGLWASYKQELLNIYARLKEFDPDKATNLQLYHHNQDLCQAYMRMWEIHFLAMYSSFNTWLLLEAITKERFGLSDQDPRFQDMMRGFDNKVYQMDKKIWEFGQLAIEMGLEDIFKENEPPVILDKLQESEKGKSWFKEFMHYMETDDVGGWRMRRFNDFTEPYWLEDPATPIGLVKDSIMKGIDYNLENIRAENAKKREEAIAAFLNQVPPEERELFESMIRLAGKASSYSEEHNLYCELFAQALMRRGYLAMGRRLAQNGAIDVPEDIFMLNPDEIDRVIMVPDGHDLRWLTRRRKAAWQEAHKVQSPPLFTTRQSAEEAIELDLLPSKDAIALKIVIGELPRPKPELGADLWGICGCAGEAEGPARVVMLYKELNKVQPGEILVCPGINPAWTPVFGLIKGVITDTGGTLSHAAIIGREFGVPTIVNTQQATAKIRTGQRIRMDATNGAVYILK